MNNNAKLWVEALRSGQYAQDTGQLKTRNGYCCLGVACELFREATGQGAWATDEPPWFTFTMDNELGPAFKDTGRLPEPVQDWLGLRDTVGYFDEATDLPVPPGLYALSALNDTGATFEQIADVIESEPKGLFKEAE